MTEKREARPTIMSISMEYFMYSSLLLYRAGLLLFPVVRWFWPATTANSEVGDDAAGTPAALAQAVRDTLRVAAYEESMFAAAPTTLCAVCLSGVGRRDMVWELRNCRHVFHKSCLDEWMEHRPSCPLCRSPLLLLNNSTPATARPHDEPSSWVVERLLYLFGDDLHDLSH